MNEYIGDILNVMYNTKMNSHAEQENIFLYFPHLKTVSWFHHFITNRRYIGDVSRVEGRKRLLKKLHIEEKYILRSHQVHSKRVHAVEQRDVEKNSFLADRPSLVADALVTNLEAVYLSVLVADCVPLLVIDPCKRCLAVVHAGWRGVVSKVHLCAVEALHIHYGSKPQCLMIGIGPHIRSCCFEVGEEVAERLGQDNVRPSYAQGSGKWMADLRRAVLQDLLSIGVSAKNIEEMEYCTSCRREIFFSHRGEGGNAGRFLLAAGMIAKNGL